MSAIQIRPMRSDEADTISRLVKSVISPLKYYTEHARSAEISKYTPPQLAGLIHEDPLSVLVATRDNDAPIGFCISRMDDGLIWLAWFGVTLAGRKQGVGAALLRALEDSARRRSSHKIWCDCRTTNEASKAVLTKMGFAMICTVLEHWYGQDFILWEKIVDADSN